MSARWDRRRRLMMERDRRLWSLAIAASINGNEPRSNEVDEEQDLSRLLFLFSPASAEAIATGSPPGWFPSIVSLLPFSGTGSGFFSIVMHYEI